MKSLSKMLLAFGIALFSHPVFTQKATITERLVTMDTYGFSDPDPVAKPDNRIYPYFRFDGFTSQSIPKNWKCVELENDYIKVSIFPEIGGKIWGAVEKSTGEEFIYYNHVVKFRDIALRGAWTSGGLELNFGIIGHAPTTATPVDYTVEQKKDGSVSCYIASYDFLTRTRWMVEVNLPSDKAYFTTRTLWHNPSGVTQPYYQWMNGAFRAAPEAEFCYPGNQSVQHSGAIEAYPIDASGNNLSTYQGNDFGADKSYHIFGSPSRYHGVYWHDTGVGSVHHAHPDKKLGMKIFLWAQSRTGAIWEPLLTDKDGQYMELQSGRMYNQPALQSGYTPFRHAAFMPQATDEFTEYWYPVKSTRGYVMASEIGALNIERENGWLKLYFSPTIPIESTLLLQDSLITIAQRSIDAKPLQCWHDSIPLSQAPEVGRLRVIIGDQALVYSENSADNFINRPTTLPSNYDPHSLYAVYLEGVQFLNQRRYGIAATHLQKALLQDPNFVPALNTLASLYYQQGAYAEALPLLRRALSVNTYDGEANLYYGLVNKALQHTTDAKDGFTLATYTPSYRGAAYIGLARIAAQEQNWNEVSRCATEALASNTRDSDAKLLLALAARKTENTSLAQQYIEALQREDPLNQLARYEAYRLGKIDASTFQSLIRNELPQESYQELAYWYLNCGLKEEAIELFSWADTHPIALYERAYLSADQEPKTAKAFVEAADAIAPDFVFPFRHESLAAIRWAAQQSSSWKPRYYEALLHLGLGNDSIALAQLESCNEADYAPLFLTRASLKEGSARKADLLKAEKLQPSWRVGKALIDFELAAGDSLAAYNLAQKYIKRYPSSMEIGMHYANTLCGTGRFAACIAYLKKMEILPFEGASQGYSIYHTATLNHAVNSWRNGSNKTALKAIADARIWPENLGAGRPYEYLVDERMENYMEAHILAKENPTLAKELLQKVATDFPPTSTFRIEELLTALAQRELGQNASAEAYVEQWRNHPTNRYAQYAVAIYEGDFKKADQITQTIKAGGGKINPTWSILVRFPNFK